MKHHKLNIAVNVKDIRPVFAKMVSLILQRHTDKCNSSLEALDLSLNQGSQEQIIKNLDEWLSAHNAAAAEINLLGEILGSLDLGRPETEILEDLPNLEENGLGVSSGSEEPVHIAPDHSQE
tara:strand:+ start:748 stop:1113 length:366 start_codon:yes stop_codon:yes gene_type:complete